MDHRQLSDELRNQLMEAAAWGKAGVEPLIESVEEDVEGDVLEESSEAEFELEEGEELHVCPLCTSMLDEAIDPEAIVEHLDVVMSLVDRLSQLNEGEEDIDDVIDETLAEALFGDEEEGSDFIDEE